ncbi:DUF3099 domain-containing protein [Jatrophihabitans sp. GAS493]|uniref:DUF3099 domain-containing protein n=1 Tax=Jatrophihabitans sp. GAS493 TaxID=1907575 RepID=UPI0012FD7DBF|nr:DUF3099 domain-containing protein [Jatrophihabitans sp. GAS493]
MRHQARDPAVRITNLAETREQEFVHRRRRYSFMMGIRVVCVIAAAPLYAISPWLALVAIVGGAVLPWSAVLLANDRPRKRTPPAREMLRRRSELALGAADSDSGAQPDPADESRDGRTVDG